MLVNEKLSTLYRVLVMCDCYTANAVPSMNALGYSLYVAFHTLVDPDLHIRVPTAVVGFPITLE